MKQAKKGNQWYFGMNAHYRVHPESRLVRGVIATAANVNGLRQAGALLRGGEDPAFGDGQR